MNEFKRVPAHVEFFLLQIYAYCKTNHNIKHWKFRGPSGPQLLVGGPSGRLDFV